jgi:hypothetical protein
MAETFDLVLKAGVVVNHDGAGMRDRPFVRAAS